jgi:hypothetical protein
MGVVVTVPLRFPETKFLIGAPGSVNIFVSGFIKDATVIRDATLPFNREDEHHF